MKRADSLFAALVKERDGFCLYCGSTEYLQCAHIIGRSYKSIRCDFDNAVTLCRACHMRFTHKPLEWEGWIEDRIDHTQGPEQVRNEGGGVATWQILEMLGEAG